MKTLLIATGLFLSLLGINLPAQGIADSSSTATGKKPNIIFILADDLGYGDLSLSGNPYIKTPNLDDLARHAILCTKGHAAYPVCMPSRISILSGRYSDRTGARMNIVGRDPKLDQPWLPHLLKSVGYTTCAVGKWHVGNFSPPGMARVGFDTWAITAPGGWCDYWDYTINRPPNVKEPSNKRYCTDVLTEEAVKFIDQNTTHPFFLYLCYNAPHFPLEAPADEITPFKNKPGINNGTAVVYAMVQHMDRKIGELIADLKKKGLYDNTVIVFTSDNGPDVGTWYGLNEKRWNDNLHGHKLDVWEGGIKVPTFISWPAAFGDTPKPFDGVVDGIDWQPTLCAIAGVADTDPRIDGTNLLPRFLGQSHDPIPTRYWSYNIVRPLMVSNGAVREGDWKLVRPPIPDFNIWGKATPGVKPTLYNSHDDPSIVKFTLQPADLPVPDKLADYELFNLAQDPDEKHDLAAQQPERVQRMKREFEAWFKDVESGPDNADVDSTKAPPRKSGIEKPGA